MSQISEAEYKKLLDEHDWFYNMSDDSRAWIKGSRERIKLENLAKENILFEKLYKEKASQFFTPLKLRNV